MRGLIRKLSERVAKIGILECVDHIENASVYERRIGYAKLLTQWSEG
jgi:hypothetical protein